MARILIVEDEPLIAMMLADWLIELGHEALGPAHTVSQALEMISELSPGAAILDVNLHEHRCDAVAEVLAARSIPMAFATGNNADAILARYPNAPALVKPYDFETARNVTVYLSQQIPTLEKTSRNNT